MTIQGGVNAAAAGDTVMVDPSTYTEQVTIGKSVTVQGVGAGVIIQAPTTLMPDTFGQNVLVEVNNAATVNITNLTIQGPNPKINSGILVVGGATANVTGTMILHINQGTNNFGNQTGRGIQVGSTSFTPPQVGHATITNCTIADYQKTGIVTGGAGTSITITGTTVTGVGPNSLIAQNGIQISAGTAAQLSNNTVSGNEFTGSNSGPDPTMNTQSVGIFNFSDGSSFTGNTDFGNDEGIFNANSGTVATTISGNTVQNNRFQGIILTGGTATVSNNTITGNNIGVALRASSGDAVNAQGTLVSNNITNNGNGGLTFAGGGIVLLKQTGATTVPVVTANFNRIVGNSVGLDNSRVAMSATVDATNNWWGSNAGPGGAGSDSVAGPVTFNPWLVLQVTASPTSVVEGGVATVVADMTRNSAGTDTSALGRLPDGIPVSFGSTAAGTVVPATGFIAGGKAAAQFTAGNTPGTATVSATVDHQTGSASITVGGPPHAAVGVFDPVGEFGQPPATWYLRDSNSPGSPDFGPFSYGGPGWISVVGDWNGDGVTTIGVVDPATMTWYLRNSNTPGSPDIPPFQYGAPGDIPVVGDWNGDGIDTVGVFDPFARFGHPAGTWYLRNSNSSGDPDIPLFQYGATDWVPVVGDWNGDGVTTIGMFDPVGEFGQPPATWYLRNSNNAGGPDFPPFVYGAAGWKPVVGDWNGDGVTTVGAFDPVGQFGQPPATWYLRNSNNAGAPDIAPFSYGAPGWAPQAGIWTDPPLPLHVLGGAVLGGPPVNLLTQDVADALKTQALARLQQDGVGAAVVAQLGAVEVQIGALGPGVVATADPQSGQVVLDPSAAGHGWFVDPTPLQDEEFVAGPAGQAETAAPGGPADGRADLLTALGQEMGVAAGLNGAILRSALAPGTRNVTAIDAYFAAL
jgi:parallel beta-helix repeat protein